METAEKVKSRTIVYPSWVESVKMGQLYIGIYSLANIYIFILKKYNCFRIMTEYNQRPS